MDTAHLVGQGGEGGRERKKTGMRICDMDIKEFLDLIFHGFRGDFRDGRSDHLTQKRQLLPDLNGTKRVQQIPEGKSITGVDFLQSVKISRERKGTL
ncbi:hypothetical protein T07_8745 [Trichinella nelsoni]|uniref:Uncharacterized protein n=1 Tax=Trichinella nelsoni TaxID=6336 RepID=A0A0V0RMN8_9BILA|nr:hypothetical protein T07_8745 [Trichinella nelsoni]